MNLLRIVDIFSKLSGLLVNESYSMLNKRLEDLFRLPESEFKQELSKTFVIENKTPFRAIIYKLLRLVFPFDEQITEYLAKGIAAFSRCPADLLESPGLYPEQIRAAIVLTQRAILQMDTGEGKTYALLPAAYALARKYGRVYVICANEYLAFRDATRTKNYWDYVGLSVSYCSRNTGHKDQKWGTNIVYTALDGIAFKSLRDDLNGCDPSVNIRFDAIIIDEVDSVALDTNESLSTVRYINSSLYDWNTAIDYARRIKTEHVILDLMRDTATLSVDGVDVLRIMLNDDNIVLSEDAFARLRKAVEIAYVASQMREGYEYIVKDNFVVSVDKTTGELAYGITRNWMIPLSITKGTKVPNSTITTHGISTKILMDLFHHVSGMSGTAQEDMAEYFFEFHLPTVRIPPRNTRQKGKKEDSVWKTKTGAIKGIIQNVIEAVSQRRPVLIGTQNIMDTEMIHNMLLENLKGTGMYSENFSINIIRGDDSQRVAEIYENAGHVGSITIATQVAGRGVDIRLSNEARENGGIALFGFERSLSHSQDKQFLGRVGRQGDPYTAQFFISWEGDLMKKFGGEKMKSYMERIGIADDESIHHRWLDKSIQSAQKMYHQHMFTSRLANYMKNRIEKEILLDYRDILHSLNDARNYDNTLSDKYIRTLVLAFLDARFKNLIRPNMNAKQAEDLVNELKRVLAFQDRRTFISARFEGRTIEYVQDELVRLILGIISQKSTESLQISDRYDRCIELMDAIEDVISLATIHKEDDFQLEQAEQDLVEEEIHDLFTPLCTISDLISPEYNEQIYGFFDVFKESFNMISEDLYSNIMNWMRDSLDFILSIKIECEKNRDRTQYKIAYWTIVSSFITHNDQKQEIYSRLVAIGLSASEFYRRQSKEFEDSWQRSKDELATAIVKNIAKDRMLLDDLFIWQDNHATNNEIPIDNTLDVKWDELAGKPERKPIEIKSYDIYIIDYISSYGDKIYLPEKFTIDGLKYVLGEFMQKNPIESMQSSEGILIAFERWEKDEAMHIAEHSTIEIYFKWIKNFVVYLSQRNIVGKLPSFKDRILSYGKDILNGVRDFNVRLALAGIGLYLFIFMLLSTFGRWLPPLALRFPGYQLIDAGFFFGFLQQGIITAPVFVLLLLFPNRINIPFYRWLISAVTAIAYVYLALSPSGLVELITSLPMMIAATLIYYILTGQIKRMETVANISVSSLWLVVCFSFLLLPIFFATGLLPAIYLSLLIGYFMIFHRRLTRSAIALSSIRITDNKTFSSKSVQSVKYMHGDTGNLPHVIGLVFSSSLFLLLEPIIGNSRIVILLALFSYLIVMVLFMVRILITKFNVDKLVESLSDSGLVVVDHKKHVKTDATRTLLQARNKVIIFEASSQVVLILVAFFLLRGYNIPTTNIPLVFAIVAVSRFISVYSLDVIRHLAKFFHRHRFFSTDSFEFGAVVNSSDKNKEKTLGQKLRRLINPLASIRKFIFFIWSLILVITTLANAPDAIARIVEFFRNFFE